VEPVAATDGLAIRAMVAADVPAVVALEAVAFSTPWQPETFELLLGRDGVELLVMEESGPEGPGLVGYAILWCVLDQGELANLAVLPGRRGQGLGARLLEEVVATCRRRGVATLYLEVRDSNAAAIGLYERFGFREIGRRKNYYTRPPEDARVMELLTG